MASDSLANPSKISLNTAIIICLNAMIGSGIFVAPASLASCAGPAGIITYIIVIAAVWCIAVSLARLSEIYPSEGSFYTYSKPWAGHLGGLIACSCYLIGLVIAMGLLTRMTGIYLHKSIPTVSANILGLITLILLGALNMAGVALSTLGQQILIVTTTFPIFATTLLCATHIDFSRIATGSFDIFNILDAMRIVIFGFLGFEAAASLFPIIQNPKKNVPLALTYSILIVGIIYILFVGSIILSTPASLFSDPSVPLTVVLEREFPTFEWLTFFIHISILSAMIGTIHSMVWSASTLFKSLTHLATPRFTISQRSAIALICSGIAISYLIFKDLGLFFNLTAIFIMIPFACSLISLFTIKSERTWASLLRTSGGMVTILAIVIFAIQNIIQTVS